MPAEPRGWVEKTTDGQHVLRYYDLNGAKQRARSTTGVVLRFKTKTAARNHFRDIIAPQLRGDTPEKGATTFAAFAELWVQRHSVNVRQRTTNSHRDRLGIVRPDGTARNAIAAFGDIPLRDLERMTDEIAQWQSTLSDGWRYPAVRTLRQCLDAAVRWGYTTTNPAKDAGPNPQPPPRPVRPFTPDELQEIAMNLSACYQQLPPFAAATGLRPEEWQVLERRDIDRPAGVLNIHRTLSGGHVIELAKTTKSRRQVPLTRRALQALDEIPPRVDTPLIFPATTGGVLDLDNWRSREWAPAIDAGAITKPARIYDLRSTFASNAIAAKIDVFELARIMGTSVTMIEHHYGTLLTGAAAGIASRLDAFEAAQHHQQRGAENE